MDKQEPVAVNKTRKKFRLRKKMADEDLMGTYAPPNTAEGTTLESSSSDEKWSTRETQTDQSRLFEEINWKEPLSVWPDDRREKTDDWWKKTPKPTQHTSCSPGEMGARRKTDVWTERSWKSTPFVGQLPAATDGGGKMGHPMKLPTKPPVDDGRPSVRADSRRRTDEAGAAFLPRKTPMKPGKFDGTSSLESFLTQFEVCARYNGWTASDRLDFLRCALEKSATQLLWDFGARDDVTFEELVGRLRQRYGTEGQAETFRAQLHYQRQRAEENLSTVLHDIRRLVVLAYPFYLLPLLPLLFGIAFHLQLVLLSCHPIFLRPYHFLKLVSFLGANRTKSASVCLWLLRGAI